MGQAENEHHALAVETESAPASGGYLESMRAEQARLLLQINMLGTEILYVRRRRLKTSSPCSTSRLNTNSTLRPRSHSTGRLTIL